MFVVDRKSFIAWTEGVMLERKQDGYLVVGDNPKHEEAQERLEKGETVGFTVNGVIVSTMAKGDDGEFYEKVYEENNETR